jgi:hypothetical protein
MKRFIGLMPFEAKLSGEAAKLVGSDKLPKFNETLPKVEGDKLIGMPTPKAGVVYVCNAFVFNKAKEAGRTDIAMFDPNKTVRDADGKAVSQGGFIFP